MANFIAIDLESQGLYVVAASAARGSVKVSHALAWNGDDGDPPPALTAETAKTIGETLREKMRAAGIGPAPLIVSIGRDRVILKELKYPPVAPGEEAALVRFQAMKEMSESPEDVVLDYAPLEDVGGERRAMAVVMRKELFNAIQVMCQAIGQKLTGVSPRPYALAAGMLRTLASGTVPPPPDKGDAIVALTLGPAGGEFTVVQRGAVQFTLAIPAPVVANESMLVAQIRRNLAVYAGQHPGQPIQAVYLAEVEGPWTDRLGSALSVPVHAFDPLVGAAPDVPESIRGRFTGAVGLLAGRSANALPIDFASPRQPQVQGDPAKKRLVIVSIVAAVLTIGLLGGGYMVASAATSRAEDLAKKRDDLKDELERGAPDRTRLSAVDGWSGQGVNWLDELYELSERMPENDSVRVSSFTGAQIAPDKKRKQESQASLELRLAATSNPAGANLMSAYVHDNPTPNKYYAGTNIAYHGVNASNPNNKYNQSVTIKTKVNHREPKEYESKMPFTPPKRPARPAGSVSSESTASPEVAPAPSEKKAAK